MAHNNIESRREEVKLMLDKGFSHSEIKVILSNKYECHKSAIHADILYFKNEGIKHTVHLTIVRESFTDKKG